MDSLIGLDFRSDTESALDLVGSWRTDREHLEGIGEIDDTYERAYQLGLAHGRAGCADELESWVLTKP